MAADSASKSSFRRAHSALTACGHHAASSASAQVAGLACALPAVRGGVGSRVTSTTRARFSSSAAAAYARSAASAREWPRERAADHTPHTSAPASSSGGAPYTQSRARVRATLPTAALTSSSTWRWGEPAERRTASRAPL
ncbi:MULTISPECIES: hypothetical protein [unclassified Streptomyces]|uniref:hypothetical protein n=1 Tax=unclassified Streptomyces TaxID=2593676 RepID=UPI00093A3746|nr:hypothetical protein [Streptomyces sp. CB01883]OKJ79327.1 hypothetical protein AMK32_31650 [Streptomyces sp. CB01883]